jgi:hypothetical protein
MKIIVFYHVWQISGWELLFQQQIMALYSSGLYDKIDNIYICLNGEEKLPFYFDKFIVLQNKNLHNESDTLNSMWKLSQLSPNTKILYIHTKGISYQYSPGRIQQDAWRLYMEHFVIHKWEECIEKLNTHDVVGVEWLDSIPVRITETKSMYLKKSGFFFGNFWWANSDYIKTLDPKCLYEFNYLHKLIGVNIYECDDFKEENKTNILRFNSEVWVGLNCPNAYNFKTLELDLYDLNALHHIVDKL